MIEAEPLYESDDVMVSHPGHYQSSSGLEVIDVIEIFTENLRGIEATDTGNLIKYILRWPMKNGLQDLEKTKWYLTHLYSKTSKPLFGRERITPIPKEYDAKILAVTNAFSVSTDDERAITAILAWSVTHNRSYIKLAMPYVDTLIKQEKEK